MGGQPWLKLELHGPAMGSSPGREGRGKERGQGACLGRGGTMGAL
jgi:hypothetical protein